MSIEREGVLLPNVPPEVGELLIGTLRANPDAPFVPLVFALIAGAPDEHLKIELLNAAIEFATAKATNRLAWLHTTGGSLLIGTKVVTRTSVFKFGAATWPMAALHVGPPKVVTVNVGGSRRPFWVASEGLDGAVVRASEAAALGQVLIEEFGGSLIEDREGEAAAKKSLIEGMQSQRVRQRAEARAALQRLTIVGSASARATAPMIEASPGLLNPGDRLVPEGKDAPLFEVHSRINGDWVMITAVTPGDVGPAGGWYYADGREVIPGQYHVGWTEEAAAPAPPPAEPAVGET